MIFPLTVFGQVYTWFDEPGEVIEETSVKVFQVWSPSKALVWGKKEGSSSYYGITYLYYDPNGNFYDDQILKVSYGMEIRRIGTVQYPVKDNRIKTVPIIQIMKKQKKTKKKHKQQRILKPQ